MRIVKGEKDPTVLLINWGKNIVFYGPNKKNPDGKIDPGRGKRIPANTMFWCVVGEPNVQMK